jgi:Ca2+-binding RTX toxin-like protein
MRRGLLSALVCTFACGPAHEGPGAAFDRQRLTPLQTPCLFSAGTMAIVLAANEEGVIERRLSDSALLVNGDPCNSAGGVAPFAKSTTAVTATVLGAAGGDEELTLDFVNGAFLRGTSVAPGLVIDLAGGGSDTVAVRLSAMKDVVSVGTNGWDISGDGVRDFTLSGVESATVLLGDGSDVFSAAGGGLLGSASPSSLPLTVYGGPGDDVLTGGEADDALHGDTGADVLSGGASLVDSDVYVGGAGLDTVTYGARGGAVTITVGVGADDGAASEHDDVQADVETVIGGSGDDSFTGTSGPQTFYGGAGGDTFFMGLLASTGAGADTAYGETGLDTVDYGSRLEAVSVTMDLNVANDGAIGEGDNVRNDVEQLICPTAAVACTVTGNALDNRLTGGGGADTLDGAAGDDTFIMGASGGIGAGADNVTGGAGVDLIDFSVFGAVIDVRMDGAASATQGKRIATDVENLVCPTAHACTVLGNAANNHLWGSSQADTLSSAGGDDFVETLGAADVVDCGDGSDILIGAGASPVGTTCEL